MSQLIRNRWLHRTLIVAALLAIGFGIHRIQPPEPMCVVDAGNLAVQSLAPHGRFLTALPINEANDAVGNGLLRIWDCRTGLEVGRHFEKERSLHWPTLSRNGRFFAAETWLAVLEEKVRGDRTLHLVDLNADTEINLPLDENATQGLHFTPSGEILARLLTSKDGKELQIYESATGRLLTRHVSKDIQLYEPTDEAVLFRTRPEMGGWDLEIWSVPERCSLAILPDAGAPVSSADGKVVVFNHVNAADEPTGMCSVWSMDDRRILARFELEKRTASRFLISPDRQWLATFVLNDMAGDGVVELRDLTTGKVVSKAGTKGLLWTLMKSADQIRFSPDSRRLVLSGGSLADIPTLEECRLHLENPMDPFEFSADSRTLFVTNAEGIIALTCETGEIRARFDLADRSRNLTSVLTPDRRFLLVHQRDGERPEQWFDRIPWIDRLIPRQSDCVVVIDTDTCRERFRLNGWSGQRARLSDDGAVMVTGNMETLPDGESRLLLLCWDVNAPKPLRWAIGVPVAMAALIGLVSWWRARKARKV